jgi:acetyl-CoA/propionyl-CoA carboxylase biotin carboxyl carrier protein
VLVANRGEIALRVMRACRELDLRTVAVYSEADRDALHVQYADEAYLIGPPAPAESYLDIDAIVDAARRARAGAVHPGYGFLAENPLFASRCVEAGLVFIGPSPEAMQRMGGKVQARREALAAGVPVVPGTTEPVASADEVRRWAEQFGYPLAIKAVAGGGGRGLKVAAGPAEVDEAFAGARREAAAYFKNDELYVEKYLADPRHIEIQILADAHGNALHLGERDCSVQRRHQKLIEEAPSPALSADQRAEMGAAGVRLARHVGYTGVGTLEFLWEAGQFFFLEMNTRIQVEHTVTEAITGVDLVKWQIAVAQGERLPWTQEQIEPRGHAIECRINAEDPAGQFRPSTGTIVAYHEPHGMGVRVESGYRQGRAIPPNYDSLVAKLITSGQDRAEALARMRRALEDFEIGGVLTTIPFHQWAIAHPVFARGDATIRFVEAQFKPDLLPVRKEASPATEGEDGEIFDDARAFQVEVNGRRFAVRVAETGTAGGGGDARRPATAQRPHRQRPGGGASAAADAITTPMAGTVTSVKVAVGDEVAVGQVLVVVEAMKMENEIVAPRAGVIGEVSVVAGASVQAGEAVAVFAS